MCTRPMNAQLRLLTLTLALTLTLTLTLALTPGARLRLCLPTAAPLDQHVLAAHLPPALSSSTGPALNQSLIRSSQLTYRQPLTAGQ